MNSGGQFSVLSCTEPRNLELIEYTMPGVIGVLCIGPNLGLKCGRERPIRVLSPRFTDPKIFRIIIYNYYLEYKFLSHCV